MTTILKLGGSVVTEKDDPETVDEAALSAAADAIADAEGPLVVVHGGGSFGHHHADRHGVSTTQGTHDARAVRAIHDAMVQLNTAVVDALQARDVSALPVHPLSAASRDSEGGLSLPTRQVRRLLDEGFVPVLHGDVIAHVGAGATVVSGDELVVELAPSVGADRVGLCSTVPGVLDESGDVIDRIDEFETVADVLGGSDATDVTGGMAGKVQALLALDVPAHVFGPDHVRSFLAGENPGTVVGDGSA